MPQYTTAGDVFSATAVRSGSQLNSFTVATSVATGGIAASIVDLGGPYLNTFLHSIGGTSVAAGAVGVDGSMDGVNFYNCIATSTVVPTTATSTMTKAAVSPARYLRLNVGTQLSGASGTFVYGGY